MTQRLSTAYSKEHCTCYDELNGDNLVAVTVVPDDGYKLRYADKDDAYDISGFALININVIDTFDNYTATVADEISDSEALAIITSGGSDND